MSIKPYSDYIYQNSIQNKITAFKDLNYPLNKKPLCLCYREVIMSLLPKGGRPGHAWVYYRIKRLNVKTGLIQRLHVIEFNLIEC